LAIGHKKINKMLLDNVKVVGKLKPNNILIKHKNAISADCKKGS
jgi:hypothetical protein